MTKPSSRIQFRYILIVLALIVATAGILLAMGRLPICKCGYIRLWSGDVFSAENSQQIADWYSLSHVIHGLLFYAALALFARRLSLGARLTLAVIVEAAWEIIENSDFVINRYREATIALDYFGDSVLNSVSDIVFMIIGFLLAWRLPVWASVALAIAFELLAAAVIRDNLTLNVIMLLHPVEAIKEWQMALPH